MNLIKSKILIAVETEKFKPCATVVNEYSFFYLVMNSATNLLVIR